MTTEKTKRADGDRLENQIRQEVARQHQEIMQTIYPSPVIPYAPTTYAHAPTTIITKFRRYR